MGWYNLCEKDVYKHLLKSKIFLSFSDMEGLGIPPIEAAIAGNKVIGYPGQGGREYWQKPIFTEVSHGNISKFINEILKHIKQKNLIKLLRISRKKIINKFSTNQEKKHLIKVTEECLYMGIKEAKCGNTIGDIGYAVQNNAEKNGYSVVRDLVGHGIGQKLHEEPQVPNFGFKGKGPLIQPGLCLAIEPMINCGSFEVYTKEDNWTICTKDGKPSAHFEHSIAITEKEVKILTK